MAKARVISEAFFDNTVQRLQGEEFDADPLEQFDPLGDTFIFVDPAEQKRAEEAYQKRRNVRHENNVRAEIEERIRQDAEARLRAKVEQKMKAELDSKSEAV
jgi:hypothetical protein